MVEFLPSLQQTSKLAEKGCSYMPTHSRIWAGGNGRFYGWMSLSCYLVFMYIYKISIRKFPYFREKQMPGPTQKGGKKNNPENNKLVCLTSLILCDSRTDPHMMNL